MTTSAGNPLKSISQLGMARLVSLGVELLASFFVLKFLEPREFGVWIYCLVYFQVGDCIHLGIRHGLDRQLPFLRGQGAQPRTIAHTASQGIVAITKLSLLYVVLSLVAAACHSSPQERYCLILLGVCGVLHQLTAAMFCILRSRFNFGRIGRIDVISSLVRVAATLSLVPMMGAMGLPVGYLLAEIYRTTDSYAATRTDFSLPWRHADPHTVWKLLQTGFPIVSLGFLAIMHFKLDRIAVRWLLQDAELLGQYGMTLAIMMLLSILPQTASTVTMPRFSEFCGRRNNKHFACLEALHIGNVIGILTLFVGLALLLFAVPLLNVVLPRYAPGLAVLPLIIVAAVPNAYIFSCHSLFAAFGKTVYAIGIQLFTTLLAAGGMLLSVYTGRGLGGIAISISMAAICQASLLISVVLIFGKVPFLAPLCRYVALLSIQVAVAAAFLRFGDQLSISISVVVFGVACLAGAYWLLHELRSAKHLGLYAQSLATRLPSVPNHEDTVESSAEVDQIAALTLKTSD